MPCNWTSVSGVFHGKSSFKLYFDPRFAGDSFVESLVEFSSPRVGRGHTNTILGEPPPADFDERVKDTESVPTADKIIFRSEGVSRSSATAAGF